MANTKVTGDLIAGGTITTFNLVDGSVTAAKLNSITTDSISEGANLFYTDARVATYLSGNGYDTATNIISTITDSAPTTLDTLNELAAALGDDPNFATTVTNSIATKLPLAGGTISGNLTVSGSLTGTLATAAQPNVTSVGTLSSLAVSGNLTVDTNTLFVDAASNEVGIGTTSNVFGEKLTVGGFTTNISGSTYAVMGANSTEAIFGSYSNHPVIFRTNNTERVRIDFSGTVLINKTLSEAIASPVPANLQVTTTGVGASIMSVADDVGPSGILALGHGRGNASGLLQNNDAIGQIRFAAGDGTDAQTLGAQISVEVDGTASANDMPSRMVFSTTPDGAASPTEKLRITQAGYLRMASGTLGIQFGGDTAAANALDDYEEGTWTPSLPFGGGTTGQTYTAQTGKYTKIGNKVYANGFITFSNKGTTISGAATITGLPFAVGSGNSNYAPVCLWFNVVSFVDVPIAYANIGTTGILLQEITNAGGVTNLDNTNFANNSQVIFSLSYFVD
jgi:hypothetical protein